LAKKAISGEFYITARNVVINIGTEPLRTIILKR